MSESLHDKEDILSFIGIDLKNYLSVMRLVSDDYNTVLKVKVLTPVNIDNIYKE